MAGLDRSAFPPALARIAREVALVGNGSGTRGSGLAAEIQAHDAVVRINDPVITGFGAEVGTAPTRWSSPRGNVPTSRR
jgi:hypothetical protein